MYDVLEEDLVDVEKYTNIRFDDSPVLGTILFQSGEPRSPEQAGRTVVAG
jgi:hypothetical protein